MTSLSTHVLDIELGRPAVGVPITLFRGAERLAQAETSTDGRIAALADDLAAGAYRLEFDVSSYLARTHRAVAFLRRVSIEFELSAAERHYHVPLLLSPYACTSYRGS